MSSDMATRASKAKESSLSAALSEPSLLSKALHPTAHAEWHKDEALDVFWWLKQFAAVVVGVALGCMGVTGWPGFVVFAVAQYLVANVWAQHAGLVGVCVEPFEIFTENAFVAAGTFVVLWTVIYSSKVSLGLL
ncbi:UNVERIFIED_CONTAM: hypothetical protein HHA_222090 [Hammondia hammondi]|eukprot:XP_008886221.1 hypothetical protein HHA_222090 [Hammondia hammondi]